MPKNLNIDRTPQIEPRRSRKDAAIEQIKHYIRSHRLKPGERLPTVRQMSESFESSTDAVWRALRQMAEEEWLNLQTNKRYTISDKVYTQILKSVRVRAVFSGKRNIYFTGFRRVADALIDRCNYENIDLQIELLPRNTTPDKSILEDCDFLMIDSDSSRTLLETFDSFPVPVIGLDANYSDLYHTNIVTDHMLGGRLACEAMLKSGSKDATILYHADSKTNPRITSRIDGFRQAWFESGRPPSSLSIEVIEWHQSPFAIALSVRDFLEKKAPKGNYFVADGQLALSFLEVSSYLGISIPKEVQLIGYDGSQLGELSDPPMTTIQQDMDQIANSAVDRIQNYHENDKHPYELIRIPPILIERDSFSIEQPTPSSGAHQL